MKLILFRHGLAIEREEFFKKNQDDSLRPLVAKGKERAELVGKELKQMLEEVDLLVTSPYLRAEQTAQILKKQIKCARYEKSAELIPSAPPQAFASWLKAESKTATTIIAVGHEPQLSTFATWCLTGSIGSIVAIKKGGALCLDVESFEELSPKSTELKWLIQPSFFE